MNRRQTLKLLSASFAFSVFPHDVFAAIKRVTEKWQATFPENHEKDYLYKITNFEQTNSHDLHLEASKLYILDSTHKRLKRIQSLIGYANFSLLSIDDTLKISKEYASIGRFSKQELSFMEMVFYKNSSVYGFLGEKPIKNFTGRLNKKNIIKVAGSGQYLYRGDSLSKYTSIKKTIGDDVILTSGLRGVAKQLYLFLNKTVRTNGNLSRASRSLAPPGYSLHGIGDFDVGQRRFGVANFSIKFTSTPVYEKLIESGFCDLRYTKDNRLGVRYEPWHIKV